MSLHTNLLFYLGKLSITKWYSIFQKRADNFNLTVKSRVMRTVNINFFDLKIGVVVLKDFKSQ